MKRLFAVLAFSLFAFAVMAQNPQSCANGVWPVCVDQQNTSTSGTVLKVGSNGGLAAGFGLMWTGSPTGVSTTIAGCYNLPTTPKCETLATVSGSTEQIVHSSTFTTPALDIPYDYFQITSTWTGSATFYERTKMGIK